MTLGAIRTFEVKPPSARVETVNVLRAFFHIALWSGIVISGQTNPASHRAVSAGADLTPSFVARPADLDGHDQRVLRAFLEGIGEAERRRSSTGAWPSVVSLASEGIPPFAVDPIDKDGYVWSLLSSKGVVNYVGVPSKTSGRPSMLVIIVEPPSGTTSDPSTPADEVHHRLSSGMLLHVGVFLGPGIADQREPVQSVSFDEGWRQVLSGGASVLGR